MDCWWNVINIRTMMRAILASVVVISVRSTGTHSEGSDIGERRDCNGNTFASLKAKFIHNGYAVFRSCSVKPETIEAASLFTGNTPGRLQDAYLSQDSVMEIATDPDTLAILSYVNGKDVFPFQTLNFPVATQQPTHSDVVHFDTLPQRGLMTAAWMALEDIHPDSGPLMYYPGSHRMGLWDIDELGIRVHEMNIAASNDSYKLYERKLQEAIDHHGLKPEYGALKKGESLVWAASLLHGGSKLKDPKRTRKSQVTHYFMVGAKKYWVPLRSVTSIDHIMLKCHIPSCAPSKGNIVDCAARQVERFKSRKSVDTRAAKDFGVKCN